MSLDRRPEQTNVAPPRKAPRPGGLTPEVYDDIKRSLHSRLVDRLNLEMLAHLTREQLAQEVNALLGAMVEADGLPLNRGEREQLVVELIDEILGLGPIEPLLRDDTVSDILVNTFSTIYIERGGRLERTDLRFRDNEHLLQTINRIVSRVGRRVDEASPMVDARLEDGSRVNAIVSPLAVDGPILSIRRFGKGPMRVDRLVQTGSMSQPMAEFLGRCVKSRLNTLVAGGTGSGKTTMLNALSSFIPDTERIVTIEDAAELRLQQAHVVRLETRPSNVEGTGEVLTRDLVRNALRMRPDRIIVGEIRSAEVIDMLQAMNTGHEGSMGTIHANTPRDALTRMRAMIGMAGVTLSEHVTTEMITRALDLIVQVARGRDGTRRVTAITEVTGMEGTGIQTQDIFVFQQGSADAAGRQVGEFMATGIWPRCAERLAQHGFELREDMLLNRGAER